MSKSRARRFAPLCLEALSSPRPAVVLSREARRSDRSGSDWTARRRREGRAQGDGDVDAAVCAQAMRLQKRRHAVEWVAGHGLDAAAGVPAAMDRGAARGVRHAIFTRVNLLLLLRHACTTWWFKTDRRLTRRFRVAVTRRRRPSTLVFFPASHLNPTCRLQHGI